MGLWLLQKYLRAGGTDELEPLLAAATRAARCVRDAQRLSGREVETVHVVGGGARNRLLCQLTADACGVPVVAGPVEAAALGNVLVQARASGAVPDGLPELRALLRATQPLRRYEPSARSPGSGPPAWERAPARIMISGRSES